MNIKLIEEVIRIFEDNGQVMPLVERLLLNQKQNEEYKRSGVYAFFQNGTKWSEPTTMLYVGVSDDCHKRFVEHKSQWLRQYVSANPRRNIFYGWIPCWETNPMNLSIDGTEMRRNEVENILWKEKNQLGLRFLTEIIEQLN